MQAFVGIFVLLLVVVASLYLGYLRAENAAPKGNGPWLPTFLLWFVIGVVGAYIGIAALSLVIWVFALIGIWLREIIIWFIGAVLWPIGVILPF